ncbi:MAG TPA: hypothetical protein VNT56_04740 [Acidimicrobiales bacterium]|nr:hypothetical protein [Acidimicrobiales bacterium]
MATKGDRPRRERPLRAQRNPSAAPPPPRSGSQNQVGSDLKALRARLGGYGDNLPTTPGEWHAAAWDYDQALVLAAEAIGVPHPELDMVLGRRRLTITERNSIEKGLAARGIDLGQAPALPLGRA